MSALARHFRPIPARVGGRGGFYQELFNMAFRHGYYSDGTDGDGGACPDFRVYPTPDCAQLMATLGLLFKPGATGFQVLFDVSRVGALIDHLRRHSREAGCWVRLTFLLETVNPHFVGITDLPIDARPTGKNLYGCNSQAVDDGTRVRFCGRRCMGAEDLFAVADPECALRLPDPKLAPDTEAVRITDIAGVPIPDPPVSLSAPAGSAIRSGLRKLAYGLYEITGDPSRTGISGRKVIHTGGTPAPFGLLDLLFTQPRRDMEGGVYPVPPLFDERTIAADEVGGIAYTLPFAARSTEWRYYVVSQNGGARFEDLRVEGSGTAFERAPDPVLLPNGATAVLFTSRNPVPLRRVSPQRFRLSGRRRNADGSETEIRIDCLPAAPANPVWPGPAPGSAVSEMFVYT
ncbi:hypothetical protein [Azospirillum sp. sgz302134]